MMYETEHRLRSFLNSNQSQREKLCLALLPVLGNYSPVSPRRPEGGPDGARDIEAHFNGILLTWGAVGFRNDAGSSAEDRSWAQRKFKADLDSALEQNAALPGFVFFTNVDLTPAQHETLKQYAYARKLSHVEIFDFHRLRDALDRPTGFIARLQFLDIEITKDEQLGLVHNFGQELQRTLNSGFSRMDTTLERLEKFLDVRKPLRQISLFLTLDQPLAEISTCPQVILTSLHGLWPGSRDYLLLLARPRQERSDKAVVATLESWVIPMMADDKPGRSKNHHHLPPTRSPIGILIAAGYELSFQAGGGALYFGDVPTVRLCVFASPAVASHIVKLQLDMNGYTVFSKNRMYEGSSHDTPEYVPDGLREETLRHVWSHGHVITHEGLTRSTITFSAAE